MSQYGIVLTSRNNYKMLDKVWLPHMGDIPAPVLNIDEDSESSEIDRGKNICKNAGISFISYQKRGMQNNMATAVEFFGKEVKYIIWFQHDCWPLDNLYFHSRMKSLIESGKINNFGTIGFNGLATDVTKNYKSYVEKVKQGKKPIGIVARCPLECNRRWYTTKGSKHNKPINGKLFQKPFSVEIPAWFAIALNVKMFKKYIKPCSEYIFFHAWDDLCFQFLNKNIHNVIMPDIYICHRPDIKSDAGMPIRSSTKNKKVRKKFYGGCHNRHLTVWKKRWGFDYTKRDTFKKVKNKYRKTLLYNFYKHDPSVGPLRSFDL